MTATLDSLVYLGNRVWRATASSTEGDPTFRWWLRGAVIRETTPGSATGSIDFAAPDEAVAWNLSPDLWPEVTS